MISTVKKKLAELPRFKNLVAVAWGLEKFNEDNKKAVFTKSTLPRGARTGKRFVRFAPAAGIDCHAVNWSDSYVDGDLYSRLRRGQLSKPKLVFAATAPRLRVAYDSQSYYLGHSLFSTGARDGVSYPFLSGVLSSLLGNFGFAVANGITDVRTPVRLGPAHLAELPVCLPDTDSMSKFAGFIETNVMRLIHAKQSRRIVGEVWRDVSSEHARRFASFSELLSNKLPDQKDPWVRKLMPSLAVLNRRGRQYRRVKLHSDKEAPVMRICGLTETEDEVVLAEVEFADRPLMLYAWLAAGVDARSRGRPVTMRKVLEDARVPLAAGDPVAGAHRIIEQLEAKTPRAFTAEGMSAVQTDIARIEHLVERLDALVDAEVFHLYGLTRDQAKSVMNWLHTPSLRRQAVMTFLDNVHEAGAEV